MLHGRTAEITVAFTAAPGNGTITPKNLITDQNGAAEAIWVLPDVPGDYAVTVTAPSLPGQAVTFTATATAPTGSASKIAAGGQTRVP